MSPRAYRMTARRASVEETRSRIIRSARELLGARGGIEAFTIDSVAREAGVARMTVYHQFGSKTGLIEAVFDSLAVVRVGVPRLVAALALPDPLETLAEFVATFGGVWQTDRLVIRRLQGLAALDPEFEQVWHAREARRREGLRSIVTRFGARGAGGSRSSDDDTLTDVLFALIAFETYDVIAGPKRRLDRIAPIVHQLVLGALGVGGGAPLRLPPARPGNGLARGTPAAHACGMEPSVTAGPLPPRVLIVLPDQWPRALLRAALREVGYDAVGARDLGGALRARPGGPDRGPVRLVIVDQRSLGPGGDAPLVRLLARHGEPPTMLLARATLAPPAGPWRQVLRRPVSVADVVAAAQALLPLPPAARHPID